MSRWLLVTGQKHLPQAGVTNTHDPRSISGMFRMKKRVLDLLLGKSERSLRGWALTFQLILRSPRLQQGQVTHDILQVHYGGFWAWRWSNRVSQAGCSHLVFSWHVLLGDLWFCDRQKETIQRHLMFGKYFFKNPFCCSIIFLIEARILYKGPQKCWLLKYDEVSGPRNLVCRVRTLWMDPILTLLRIYILVRNSPIPCESSKKMIMIFSNINSQQVNVI